MILVPEIWSAGNHGNQQIKNEMARQQMSENQALKGEHLYY